MLIDTQLQLLMTGRFFITTIKLTYVDGRCTALQSLCRENCKYELYINVCARLMLYGIIQINYTPTCHLFSTFMIFKNAWSTWVSRVWISCGKSCSKGVFLLSRCALQSPGCRFYRRQLNPAGMNGLRSSRAARGRHAHANRRPHATGHLHLPRPPFAL